MLTEWFTRPNVAEMARRRFKAKKLLDNFCAERGILPADIIARNQTQFWRDIRVEFIRLCRQENIGPTTVARLLKRDITTIGYHMGHAKHRKYKSRKVPNDGKNEREQSLGGNQGARE